MLSYAGATTQPLAPLTRMARSNTIAMDPMSDPDLYHCPATEAFLSVWRAHARLLAESARVCRRHGLTEQQYNALRVLYLGDPEGMACLEVAERLPNRVPDITRLLDRLLRLGMITRERLETDRRVVRIRLSESGRERVEEVTPNLAELHRLRFSRLEPRELTELSRLLQKLSPALSVV